MSNATIATIATIRVVCPDGKAVHINNPSDVLNCTDPAWAKMALLGAQRGRLKDHAGECKVRPRLFGLEYYVRPGGGAFPAEWGAWAVWTDRTAQTMMVLEPALKVEYRQQVQRVKGNGVLYDDDIVLCLMSSEWRFSRAEVEAMPMVDRVKYLRTLPDYRADKADGTAAIERIADRMGTEPRLLWLKMYLDVNPSASLRQIEATGKQVGHTLRKSSVNDILKKEKWIGHPPRGKQTKTSSLTPYDSREARHVTIEPRTRPRH